MNRFYLIVLICIICGLSSFSQPTSGTTGLLNIPTALMQKDGTFFSGANFLPEALTPETWDYNTWNYYLNITFLPFMEVSYRMTLFKSEDRTHFENQDRSISVRFQVLKERRITPSIVLGVNDILSTQLGITGHNYFADTYLTASKNFDPEKLNISATLGFVNSFAEDKIFKGVFGGISWSPLILPELKFMVEYDTKVINAGASILLFKHLHVFGMAHELKRFAGGFAFLIYLKS